MPMCLVLRFSLLGFPAFIVKPHFIPRTNISRAHPSLRCQASASLVWVQSWCTAQGGFHIPQTFGSLHAGLLTRVEEYLTGKNLVDEGVFKEAIHLVRQDHPKILLTFLSIHPILPICTICWLFLLPSSIHPFHGYICFKGRRGFTWKSTSTE